MEVLNGVAVCAAAIVGAGFASGREVMAFFSRFGCYSWVGIALAAATMGFMCYGMMGSGKGGKISRALFILLLCATGGSMLSAAGELFALTVPRHYAYEGGLLLTFAAGYVLAKKNMRALFFSGKLLIPLVMAAYLMCLKAPAERIESPFYLQAVTGAFAYGAMNMMLCVPVLSELSRGMNDKTRRRIALFTGITLLMMMALSNAVLLNNKQLLLEPLPLVHLLRPFGLFGFYLSAAVMYAAVFSTLLCVLRGLLKISPWLCVCPLLMALLGFERLVGAVYPLLGYGCVVLFIAEKFKK